jgi:hypothetical protein
MNKGKEDRRRKIKIRNKLFLVDFLQAFQSVIFACKEILNA